MTQDGPRPAPQPRVCRIDAGGGNPDPSRGGARDRPVGGRDDPGVLQDSVGGGGAPPARRYAGPGPDTSVNNRRDHDRRRDKCQTAEHTLGTYAHEAPIPRGRSAERAPPTISGDTMREWNRLIRSAAASSRSRGPGGRTPGPHASPSRITPYPKRAARSPCSGSPTHHEPSHHVGRAISPRFSDSSNNPVWRNGPVVTTD